LLFYESGWYEKSSSAISNIYAEKLFNPNNFQINNPNKSIKFSDSTDSAAEFINEIATKVDSFISNLNEKNYPVVAHLFESFNYTDSPGSENICPVDYSAPESSEEYLFHENKPNADKVFEKISKFTLPDQIAGTSAQEKIHKSFAEMKQMKKETFTNHEEEKEKTSILSPGVFHTPAADSYSNTKYKTHSFENFSYSKECIEQTRKPTPVNDLIKNDDFKTKNIRGENEISHGQPEIYHYNYLNVVSIEILLCILCVSFMTPLFIFAVYKRMSRRRTLISSNTNINESLASSSQVEIELYLGESARDNVAIAENVSKTEDRVRVNKENILRTKNVELRQKVQKTPKINQEPRFSQEQDEVIEEEQEKGEFAEFHPEKKELFYDYRTETQTDASPEMHGEKKDRQNRKFRKDNSRKKVKSQEREDITIPSKNSAEVHVRSDESCSQNIKRRNRKQELRTEPSSKVVKPSTCLTPSVNEETTGDRPPNSSQLQMRDVIFLQQGDLRLQYISERNSNFTIEYKSEEKFRTRDRALKYKLKVKKESVNESAT
ncbi:hypothetical protein AVEN_175913-1, partial [Araneus ventricosus]